ncbi:MAG: DNA mismatch endonuclease Vsr [Nitrospirae bacterium]|nr:DNA mismatch endonuclease Vsr [Nitrospirota bacterium]MCL5284221.1 DNA mismatch endonuclease Vsr [Nitrospirota bacterium]
MVDIVDKATRSRMMRGIRSGNTKPEIFIRKGLHREGFRYRLHDPKVTGHPDLVFPKYHAVLFIHGCFWHGHDCSLFRYPETRKEFWEEKIRRNRKRDADVQKILTDAGWRIGLVWECAMRGWRKMETADLIETLTDWLTGEENRIEVPKI